MAVQSTLRVRAYAKVNLGLEVLHRRDDGYHELRTILQTVDFYDELRFERSNTGIELETSDPSLDSDEGNLVVRAASLLARHARTDAGVRIHLDKRIPAGRGLGGGSADAAVTLLLLNRLWDVGASNRELHGLASRLGMDVPFFLYGGTAIGVGRGDELYPLGIEVELPIVLILPDFSISTAEAYGNLMLTKRGPARKLQHFAWSNPYVRNGLGELVNDLEGATGEHSSSIQEYKELLFQRGATDALMSGSGSAVFGVFRDEGAAEDAVAVLEGRGVRAVATRALGRARYRREIERSLREARKR